MNSRTLRQGAHMQRILALITVSLLSLASLRADDLTIGLQGGFPGVIGPRIAFLGGEQSNRTFVVDATAQLTFGMIYSLGAGYSIGGGPLYVGLRYHYVTIIGFSIFDDGEPWTLGGGVIGPEIGLNTPLFGSQTFYFNAEAGLGFRDDYGEIGVMPNVQVGLNIAL